MSLWHHFTPHREREEVLAVIRRQSDALGVCETKGELGVAIATLLRRYSPRDIRQLDANFARKVRDFEPAYRARLLTSVSEHLLGTYERALLLLQQGGLLWMKDAVPETTREYWAMVQRACEAPETRDPRLVFLKYLLAAFSMLVLDEPGHPVGTPFPGGDRVELGDGVYWCPVRETSAEIDGALCSFCPARQTPAVGYLHSPRTAPEHRRRAFIDHYHDGHYNG